MFNRAIFIVFTLFITACVNPTKNDLGSDVTAGSSIAGTNDSESTVTIGGAARGQSGQTVKGVMGIFVGDLFSNFRNVGRFTPLSKVPANEPYAELPRKDQPLDFSAEFLGEETTLEQFLAASSTSSFLVIKDDAIIYEKYLHGDRADSLHISFSMAKSVVSALIGIAVDERLIDSIDDPINRYLPQLNSAAFDGVTIKHVLQMSSGLRFNEDYSDPNSDINKMIGIVETTGYLDYINTLQREHSPGTYNHYASVNTQLLGFLLQAVTEKSLTEYMTEKLWRPMQMEHASGWVLDNQGNELAMGGLIASARDYGRLGLIYLNNGRANGRQVIPEAWVKESVVPNEEHLMPGSKNSSSPSGYMYQWWTPRDPDGDFLARGIWGQQIFVHPRNRVVIVRLAADAKSFNQDVKLAEIDYLQDLAQSLCDK